MDQNHVFIIVLQEAEVKVSIFLGGDQIQFCVYTLLYTDTVDRLYTCA